MPTSPKSFVDHLPKLFVAATMAFGLVSCGPADGASTPMPQPTHQSDDPSGGEPDDGGMAAGGGTVPTLLVDGGWVYDQGTIDGVAFEVPDGGDLTMVFDQQGTVTGTSVCNSWSATVVGYPDQVSFLDVSATEMACVGAGLMEAEAAFLAAVQAVTGIRVDVDRLTLTGDGIEMHFVQGGPS